MVHSNHSQKAIVQTSNYKHTPWWKFAAPITERLKNANTFPSTARSSTPSSSSKISVAPTSSGHWLHERSTSAHASWTVAHRPCFGPLSTPASGLKISSWKSGMKLGSASSLRDSSGKKKSTGILSPSYYSESSSNLEHSPSPSRLPILYNSLIFSFTYCHTLAPLNPLPVLPLPYTFTMPLFTPKIHFTQFLPPTHNSFLHTEIWIDA